jgi:hypothetical protein
MYDRDQQPGSLRKNNDVRISNERKLLHFFKLSKRKVEGVRITVIRSAAVI